MSKAIKLPKSDRNVNPATNGKPAEEVKPTATPPVEATPDPKAIALGELKVVLTELGAATHGLAGRVTAAIEKAKAAGVTNDEIVKLVKSIAKAAKYGRKWSSWVLLGCGIRQRAPKKTDNKDDGDEDGEEGTEEGSEEGDGKAPSKELQAIFKSAETVAKWIKAVHGAQATVFALQVTGLVSK